MSVKRKEKLEEGNLEKVKNMKMEVEIKKKKKNKKRSKNLETSDDKSVNQPKLEASSNKKTKKRKIQSTELEDEKQGNNSDEKVKPKKVKIQPDSDDDSETDSLLEKKRPKKKKKSYEDSMDDDERNRTIFVGNLPLSITRKDIEKLFSSCGKVDSVRLRSAIPKEDKMMKKVAIIKQQFSDEIKDNINAYVKFSDKSDIEKALKLNGTLLGGHHLQVDNCVKDKKYDSKYSIFVGNLSFTTSEDEMIAHFSDCGEIERVRIVRDKNSGLGKGFGFVVFKDESSVDLALKLNGENLNARQLRISRVVKKFKKFSQNKKSDGKNKKNFEKGTKKPNKRFKMKKEKTTTKSLMI